METTLEVNVKPQYRNKTMREKSKGGQNRRKDHTDIGLTKRDEVKNLCSRFASGLPCRFGTKCLHNHNIHAYLAAKPADIGSECVHFSTYGSCPYGYNCRFGKNHFVADESSQCGFSLTQCKSNAPTYLKRDVTNVPTLSLLNRLRRRKYTFPACLAMKKNANDAAKKGCEKKTKKQNETVAPVASRSIENESCGKGGDKKRSTAATAVGALAFPNRRPIDWRRKIVVAPLTTLGNLPFRRVLKRFGADVTVSEMTFASSILSGSTTEWSMLKRHKSEDIFGVQIAGSKPGVIGRAVHLIAKECDVDFIDINCGCPIDQVCNKQMGSKLMTRPSRLGRFVVASWEGLVNARRFRSVVPELTVKMRTGYYEGDRNAHKIVKDLYALQKEAFPLDPVARVGNVTVHGRTKEARYSRLADLEYVKRCARVGHEGQDCGRSDGVIANRIPVLFNGDVFDWEEWERNLEDGTLTSCMIGRGALVKPWLPTEIKERRHWDISASERFDILKDYTNFGLEHWGSDQTGVDRTRRFLLEWISFLCRYVPVGLLERVPMKINQRLETGFVGRNDMETLLGSPDVNDWVRLTEMLLGPVPDNFRFTPKHRSSGTLS
eukprot:g3880.t1